MPLPVLVRVMNDALQGLHAAHEARDERGVPLHIVHRDVTPQNILVGVDGVARLLDFGVAKAAGRAQTTQDGQIKGKLAYMAPEQLMSAGVTRETDLYAASVVLWEMLAGERLFTGESELDVVAKLLQRSIEPPSSVAPGVPPVLDALVMRGLSAKMEDRFPTARDMAVALGACGIHEATSLEVGEWVERLAAPSLADRTAKVAAIERRSESDITSSVSARPASAAADELTEVEPAARVSRVPVRMSSVRPRDGSSDALSVTLSANVVRRRARWRAAVVAVVLGLGATVGLAAITMRVRAGFAVAPVERSARAEHPQGETLAPLPLTLPSDPPQPIVATATDLSVAGSSTSPLPPVSGTPAARPPSPARRRVPPAGSARRRPDGDDHVFESRE
jgi:serine/threonine-protein kinase